MSISVICDTCGTAEAFTLHTPFDAFLERLKRNGWRLEDSRAACPLCASGEQENLEGITVIAFGIHELRHEPGRWSGVYWLWQKGGAYRTQFALPGDGAYAGKEEARKAARKDALRRVRAAEWP
jgi:hypothetical protein